MKIRNKQSKKEGYSSTFNTHACSEIIVCHPDGDMDSGFIMVLLPIFFDLKLL